MKRAFISQDGCHLTSALVQAATKDLLNIGDRIHVQRLLDISPDIQIPAGSSGTVDYIDPSTGLVEILMDKLHLGLWPWRNHIWLEPFGTDDILGGVIFVCVIMEAALSSVA